MTMPTMTIRLDRNLTSTKVQLCCAFDCKNHSLEGDELDCNLRWIEIEKDGKCRQYEKGDLNDNQRTA